MSEKLDSLQSKLDYRFRDNDLLDLALSHRSCGKRNNERLEFLGDSLLNFVVASELYFRFPEAQEGQLSRLRANMVKGETLAEMAKEFELSTVLHLGQGELKSGGAHRVSILADALEALVGAIYLDSDMATCYEKVKGWYQERLEQLSLTDVYKDPKSRLQELLQAQQLPLPEYRLVDVKGEEHNQRFIVECRNGLLDHAVIAEGSSRRKAEQQVAELVIEELKRG